MLDLVWPMRLEPAQKAVLTRMAWFAADDGTRVFPTIGRLVRDCSIAERTVQRAIIAMLDAGILTEVRPADAGAKRPTEYRINLDVVAALMAVPDGADPRHSDTRTPVTMTGVPPSLRHPYPRHDDTRTPVTVTPIKTKNTDYKKRGSPLSPLLVPEGGSEAVGTDLLGEPLARPDPVDLGIDAWNELAGRLDLPLVQHRTPRRRGAIHARMLSAGGLAGWRIALQRFEASKELIGKRRSFDWLVNVDNFARLMEGNHDDQADQRADCGVESASRGAFGILADTPEARARKKAAEL